MKSRALVCDDRQAFHLAEVEMPDPGPDRMRVRTLCSGVSIGTEFAIITRKLAWGAYPLVTGYQGTGVVEAAGANIRGYRPGDRVYYREGTKGMTWKGAAVSAVSGTHAAHAVIPADDNVAILPAGADPALSSLFVMPAVGLHGADLANARMGEVAVVYGAGQIGLAVVAACAQRGCLVVAVDIEERMLDIARRLGADHVINASRQDVGAAVRALAPAGADLVFESTGLPACLKPAMELCRDYGKFVWQGNYGQAPFPYEFTPAHTRHLTMFHPCNDGFGPCRRAVIKNMAAGTLPWQHAVTHRVKAAAAPALFDAINRGNPDKVVGAVIAWD